MTDFTQLLGSALGGGTLSQLANQVGADEESTSKAVSAALPMLIGALSRNANSAPSRDALFHALERDHDGSLLDDPSALLGQLTGGGSGSGLGGLLGSLAGALGGATSGGSSRTVNGDGILGHVLGNNRTRIEQGVAKSSGLDLATVAKLLPVLAPIVMGALGRLKKSKGLDSAGLAELLNGERQTFEQQATSRSGRSLLDVLDADDDGSVMDDIADFGAALSKSGLFGSSN